uniref:Uncharacterized protein n=1 Tax=Strongyloides papillosus TaxID=174720 RepID=A0A0N5C1L8_STREA
MIRLLIIFHIIIFFTFSLPIKFITNDSIPLLEIGKTISGSPIIAIEHGESNPIKEDSIIGKDSENDPISKLLNGPKSKS